MALCLAILPGVAAAQVVLDGSVGSAGPGLVAPGLDDLGQSATYLIHDGLGERAGPNLFHSFSRFDVGTGETATFTSASAVPPDHVLARVTGGSESRIFGQLRSTIPGADLWLINPAGWLFGAGSSLDVPASLHVTSGDYVRHTDATRFGVGLGGPSALSIAPVEAFGFLDSAVGKLTVENTRLELKTGETLSLIGGNIDIHRSAAASDTLHLPSGRLNLVSVASPGAVELDDSRLDPQLRVDSFAQLGKIEVTDGARIVYAGDPGGTAVVRADSFLLDRSSFDGTTSGVTDHPGVSADLGVRGQIDILGKDEKFAWVDSTTLGAGRGGSIKVRADSLRIEHLVPGASRRGGLLSHSQGGDPGDIVVRVGELRVTGRGATISSTRWFPSTARGGAILIHADEVWLENGGRINTDSYPTGFTARPGLLENYLPPPVEPPGTHPATADAGNVEIRARYLEVGPGSTITTHTVGSGRGGDIHIVADEMRLRGEFIRGGRSRIASRAIGAGDGGDVLIEGGKLTLEGAAGIATASWSPEWVLVPFSDPAAGDAGSLRIFVDSLYLRDGGVLGTTTWSGGNAGDIEIYARSIVIEGTGAFATADSHVGSIVSTSGRGEDFNPFAAALGYSRDFEAPAGDAGNIDINAEDVRIDGGTIISSTSSEGSAGNVTIRANQLLATASTGNHPFSIESETYLLNPAGTRTNEPLPFVHGPGGNLMLLGTGTGSELRVEGRAIVSAGTSTAAAGGTLTIDFEHVTVDGGLLSVGSRPPDDFLENYPPGSVAEENIKGLAGDIKLTARDSLRVVNGGRVNAESVRGDGGNIDIRATNAVELFGSSITAEVGTEGGTETIGGNISIDPKWVILEDGSVISANNASEGRGGNVSIRTQGLFVSPDSRISASSALGVSGTVAIDSPETNVSSELASLSHVYLDAASLIGDRCGAGSAGQGSFALRDGPAVPAAPDGALASPLLRLAANGLAQAR